ncbi:MAG TPA: hypothetical protein VKV69_00940 [Actinomycetota bacterium]|nr:hypothetical protein [Actinomycetota bacterium]
MSARRTVVLVALAASVLSAAVVTARLATSHWDASAFVRAGNVYAHPGQTPKNLTVIDGIGYDGQFYYRLALDPFSGARTKFGITLDQPGRRQQRILYPVLAWIFSGGGKPGAVPWALIVINAVGLVLIALVGTTLVRSPWWGLAFAVIPGVLVALTHDTGEVIAILLALGFLTLFRRDRFALATIALTFAAFARETTLVFALGLLVAALIARRRTYLVCALVPLIAFGAWQVFLGARWGTPPLLSAGGRDISPIPFYGLILAGSRWVDRGARVLTWNIVFATASLAFLAAGLRALRRSTAIFHERAAFILALILVPFLRSDVWFNFTSFLRAMSEATVLGSIVLLDRSRDQSANGLSTEGRVSAGTP